MNTSSHHPLSFLFVSDIHLGSPYLNPKRMLGGYYNFQRFQSVIGDLECIKHTQNCSHVFFLGDTFDKPISIDDENYHQIKDLFRELMRLTPLTILRGTKSHDGLYQIKNLMEEIETNRFLQDIDCLLSKEDYKIEGGGYIPTVDVKIMYFDRPGNLSSKRPIKRSFGFIPDNVEGTKEDIINMLKEKMKEKDLKSLDYLLTHVLWDFHVDPKRIRPDIPVFSKSDFPFVKKHIVSGHIHQHQERGKLVICGSATRTRFEETDRKGVTIIKDYGKRTEVVFIPLYERDEMHVFYPTVPYSELVEEIEKTVHRSDTVVFPVYAELDTYLQNLLSEKKIKEKEVEYLRNYFNVDNVIDLLKKNDPERIVVKANIPHHLLNTDQPLPSIPVSASENKRKQIWVNHILSIMGYDNAK